MSEFSLEAETEAPPAQEYRVLARKYRPTRFADLIGQDAMVQTLANAIAKDRIAHAFLMTGVRGVGKTSTARLIAKALNCIGPDGQGGPTIDPCGVCEPCKAITEGRFIDVVEMDAASHTGVDDMRAVIDSVRYASVSGRYKIHIIDEVHMLSKSAFNALLKTLEEPPPHVKFIFATTELDKVPVTVLSRTQRFDLKRIPADKLEAHFRTVSESEGIGIEDDAVRMIAAAAEGSVRDGLSLLDQAIAHADGEGAVTGEAVRAMLGLSDRGRTRALLSAILTGDSGAALAELASQYDLGVGPDKAVESLLELVHAITRRQVGADIDLVMSEDGHAQLDEWAGAMSPATLHRFWQLLLKGLEEVKRGTMALQTAEMVILRLIHAAQMPDPGALMKALNAEVKNVEVVRGQPEPTPPKREPVEAEIHQLRAGTGPATDRHSGGRGGQAHQPGPDGELTAEPAAPAKLAGPTSFAGLSQHLLDTGENWLYNWLDHGVGMVSLERGRILLSGEALGENADRLRELRAFCAAHYEGDWDIRLDPKAEGKTGEQLEIEAKAAERAAVMADPNVQRLLAAFPDAELLGYDLNADIGGDTAARKQGNA